MRSLEEVFVKEFKNSTQLYRGKNIYNIELPKECESWEVTGTEVYAIKGIKEADYDKLNLTMVRKLPKGFTAKRRVIDKVTRSFKKDDNGDYVYEDYKVPTGSIVVTSDKSIDLPYKRYLKQENGYGYIDFTVIKGKTIYMYVLPKTVLYKVNQTALALSVKNMKSYAGCGYKTWEDGTIFLHVVPYNPNAQYAGSKILKTGTTTNFLKEIEVIVSYWQQIGLIPDISLCGLQTGENLAIVPISVSYDTFIPIENLPLSDKEIFGSGGDENESEQNV